ncbi:hypothetical protein V1505DRAFT_366552 [Lipomyces doorenjongii]
MMYYFASTRIIYISVSLNLGCVLHQRWAPGLDALVVCPGLSVVLMVCGFVASSLLSVGLFCLIGRQV